LTIKSTLYIIRLYLTIAHEMNNIVWLESIRTEKGHIETKNANLPQVETYAEFWNIMTNQKNEALYTKVDNLGEIIVRGDNSNSENTPETNKRSIIKEQQTTDGMVKVELAYMVGNKTMESFVGQYISHEIKHYKEVVQIQISQNSENTEIFVASKEELWTIADEVTTYEYTPEGIKAYFKNTNILQKDIQKDYDATLKLIKDRQKNKNKPTILEKNMLRLMEHKHTKDTRNIEQLERTIANLSKEYRKETNVDTRQENAKKTHLQLLYYRSQGQKLSKILHNESAQKNFVDNPDTYMDIPVESSKDALLLRNIYNTMSKERFRINQLLTDANFKNIKDKNGQTMQEYLTATLEDGATAKEAFVPSSEYQAQYDEVLKNYPQLHEWMQKDPTDKSYEYWDWYFSWKDAWWKAEGKQIDINPMYTSATGGWCLDRLTPWFITEGIDKLNAEPATKERLKTLSWAVFLVGAGVLAWKTVSRTRKAMFGKEEMTAKDRWWIATGAAIFGGSYVSSGNIFNFKSLTKDLGSLGKSTANRFSSSPENLGSNDPNASAEVLMTDGINTMNTIFRGRTWEEINSILIEENGKTKIDYKKAKIAIQTNKANIPDADTRLQMINTLEKSPNQNIIHLWVQALWLNKEKLAKNGKKKYEELVNTKMENFFHLIKFMDNNEYKRRNPDMVDDIYDYMGGKKGLTPEKLGKMGAFEKDEILTEDNPLKNNIENLTTITDTNKKTELYHQSLKVYKELKKDTNYKWNFEFIEKNGQLYLKTYNKETAIDLEKKQLGSISLYTTYQTLKAANLTNRLQDIFAWKTQVDKPFNPSILWRDIEFEKNKLFTIEWIKNPREFVKNKLDTEAVAAWRWGTLNQIAPSLEDQKAAYIDYLNSLPWRKK